MSRDTWGRTVNRETEFRVEVVGRRQIADQVVELNLRTVDGEARRWEPGAHIDLIFTRYLSAQYSLCGDPDDRDTLTLAVQREPRGRGASLYVHNMITVGKLLRARGPRNDFPLLAAERYLFIAGGIGITPLLPMIRAVAARGDRWTLAYGGRTRPRMAYLPQLAALGGDIDIRPQDEAGPLDLDALLRVPEPGTHVYCCGPESLISAVERRGAEWPPGSLHLERFAPKAADPAADTAFEVECARSGVTVRVPPGTTILDALARADVYAEATCRVGTCGVCETPVLEGTADHRDFVLGPQERQHGKVMMICCSRAHGPRLVLDI
ncbi:MAG TPA: PDR/VanB family oxidoreductase [Actinospica sp.]|jgi:ferredoxin-NADP reductase|nr:PDR/VanB family oxidoreductase [Actinospica sp.]